jgi:chitobiase/beta-hexosaminidase-like protein
MEFSTGNYWLLKSALEYANDTTPPVVTTDSILHIQPNSASYEVRFKSNEASSIYYTTDGSTPTTASTEWKPPRARALPLPLDLPAGTTLKWIAHDFKGNMSAVKSEWLTPHVDTPGTVGGSVPATLSLTLGTAAQFGAFTPGITKTYTAATSANVISSAGDAALSVADPSSTATGHLVNGAFSLPQPLQARGRNATNPSTTYANVGSSASPLTLLTYSAPIANDPVTLEFSQLVNANDALRTGTYSKALTFTLSTTTP